MSRRIDFKKFYKNQTFIFVENLATEIKLNTHFFCKSQKNEHKIQFEMEEEENENEGNQVEHVVGNREEY